MRPAALGLRRGPGVRRVWALLSALIESGLSSPGTRTGCECVRDRLQGFFVPYSDAASAQSVLKNFNTKPSISHARTHTHKAKKSPVPVAREATGAKHRTTHRAASSSAQSALFAPSPVPVTRARKLDQGRSVKPVRSRAYH
eukprot:674606-Hanusia_phi.AAC.1